MTSAETFLQDVLAHFRSFAESRRVTPEEVYVRFSLADGSTYFVRGLQASPGSAGVWGLIESGQKGSADALAVREQHIVKVEFAMNPRHQTVIGLHTEAHGS